MNVISDFNHLIIEYLKCLFYICDTLVCKIIVVKFMEPIPLLKKYFTHIDMAILTDVAIASRLTCSTICNTFDATH